MADYYTLLTNDGLAYETACKAAGVPIKLTKMSVGDGNGAVYNPESTAKALRREVWRGDINALLQDPNNSSWLIAELTIPDSVGGWYVREAGIWTDTGVLYAVVKYPESFKPLLATSGSGKEFYLRAIFQTSNAASVTLQVDETVVKATRAWVTDFVAGELAKRDAKQSARVATVGPITLSGAQTIDGVAVVAGDRVLVKDQAAASANGLYVAAVGAWTRSTDADTGAKVSPGLLVAIEEGTANADTLWQLVTDGAIVLGTTALTFVSFYNGTQVGAMLALKANLASPTFTGDPKAPTPARFDNDTSLATTEFVKAMGLEFSAVKDITAAGAALVAEDAGKVVRINLPASGAVVLPALAALPGAGALLLKNVSSSSVVAITPAGADTLPQPLTLPPLCSALLVARPGAAAWLVAGGLAEVLGGLTAGIAGQVGLRNWIINGGFDVWQRGTSFAANGIYSADRFAIFMVGSSMTVSQQEFPVGQTDVPGARYFLRAVVSSVPGASNYADIHHRIEDVRRLAGKVVTVSFYAKADSAKNIAIDLSQIIGAGGNVDGIGGQKFAVSTNWQRFFATIRLPSIAGKSPSAASNTTLRLWFDAGATYDGFNGALGQQSGTFDIANVQLEEGWVATPFEFRPLSVEIAMCQRYFESGFFKCSFWSGASGQSTIWALPFKSNKRATPTVSASGTSLSNASAAVILDVDVGKFTAGATSNAVAQVNASFAWAADSEL